VEQRAIITADRAVVARSNDETPLARTVITTSRSNPV